METTAARAERLYTQIKAIAITAMQSERPGHTLQPTAVANEAFLRLADYRAGWNDDSEFMRAVVTTVRRVLVDHARTKGRKKRGGAHQRIELFDVAATESNVDLLQVDELLQTRSAGSLCDGGISVRWTQRRPYRRANGDRYSGCPKASQARKSLARFAARIERLGCII